MKLGLIGFGSVARQALEVMSSHALAPLDALVCLSRPGACERARAALQPFSGRVANDIIVVDSVEALCGMGVRLAAEAAGHGAVREAGPALLAGGVDLVVTSAGSLANDATRDALDRAAVQGCARWTVCSGAIGGLDILAAARLSGLEEVVYTSRKPPHAWAGTPAEALVDLKALAQAAVFYEGDAQAAARDYPQNANVAATIALVGAGFARTRVRLVADPGVQRNVHEIVIRSGCADVRIEIAGHPSPDNPKTSLTTGFALAADLLRRLSA